MALNWYKGKTVFLTGDTGFKGSWLVIWLLELGAKVTGYALPPDDIGNYTACGLRKRFRHIDGDIGDVHLLTKSLKECRPDIAFHLAAQPLVLDSYKAPLYTFGVNVMGTARFLEAARACRTLRAAVVVTTDKVYENPEHGRAFRESDSLGGHDPYSASKAAAEIITQSYARSFFREGKCAVASARAGNVIGGGDFAANRIVPDCVRALRSGRPVTLRNPSAIRPWQHVLEPLYGYLLLGAALAQKGGGRGFSGAWNFGPSKSQVRTVRELAQRFVSEWGRGEVKIERTGRKPHEAKLLRLNSAKAAKKLGWRPKIDFAGTIKQTVEEYTQMEEFDPEELFLARIKTIRKFEE